MQTLAKKYGLKCVDLIIRKLYDKKLICYISSICFKIIVIRDISENVQ